jgi:hypothetical protein
MVGSKGVRVLHLNYFDNSRICYCLILRYESLRLDEGIYLQHTTNFLVTVMYEYMLM